MASMRSLLATLPIRRFRNPPPLVPVVRLVRHMTVVVHTTHVPHATHTPRHPWPRPSPRHQLLVLHRVHRTVLVRVLHRLRCQLVRAQRLVVLLV